MGLVYGRGWYGLPVDQTKCIEFLRQSADLGCRKALHDLGYCHLYGQMGLEQNDGKALFYLKKAAEDGDMHARHRLGCVEDERGDDLAAMRHFRLPASGGYRASMEYLIDNFEDGLLHYNDLVETLQAFYRARAEVKSEHRDEFIKLLKGAGEYIDDYDM